MNRSGACASRSYLQCLVCLSDILTDTFPALPTGQPALYYTAVLGAKSPETVLPGQPVKYCRRALAALDPSTTTLDTPGEDEDAEEPRHRAYSDEDVIMAGLMMAVEPHLRSLGSGKHGRSAKRMTTLAARSWAPRMAQPRHCLLGCHLLLCLQLLAISLASQPQVRALPRHQLRKKSGRERRHRLLASIRVRASSKGEPELVGHGMLWQWSRTSPLSRRSMECQAWQGTTTECW